VAQHLGLRTEVAKVVAYSQKKSDKTQKNKKIKRRKKIGRK
jgi:hypothetical protein